MLRRITWKQFIEWRIYDELEPFGEERGDARSAQIAQALWNIARDVKKNPKGWPLSDFILAWGDAPRLIIKQSLETQELLIDSWIAGSNAVFALKEAQQCQLTSAPSKA